ncbi:MAG TPA: heavy-metal-associated domain-containing protein [Desulfobacteraceae bacterium]|nr:heavy-metal-associated domain-containing protein [Desulfobacteraceae bacterium]
MALINIKGMSCEHCVKAVTKALEGVEGITDVRVDLEKGQAEFREESPVDMKKVAEVISKAGYEVS